MMQEELGSEFMKMVRRARKGDPTAIETVLRGLSAVLRREVRNLPQPKIRRIGDSDLIQVTLLDVSMDLCRFRGETDAELIAWLNKIMENNFRNELRRLYAGKRDIRREQSLTGSSCCDRNKCKEIPDPSQSGPEESAIHAEQVARLRARVDRLPAHYRFVYARRLQGESWEVIGRRLHCSGEAARQIWVRAIAAIRAS